jgi:hypothetical protein
MSKAQVSEKEKQLRETAVNEGTDRLIKQCEEGARLLAGVHGFVSAEDAAQVERLVIVLLVTVYFGYQEKMVRTFESYFDTHPAAELRDLLRETIRMDIESQLKQKNTLRTDLRSRWNMLASEALRGLGKVLAEAREQSCGVEEARPDLFRIFNRTF